MRFWRRDLKPSRDSLRGYILEEVLAYLIRKTGYRLLVDPQQDPQELAWAHNGLVVRGRGAVHQVDVLGELSWIPAFTYPLRLFVEAKFRKERTGIENVRNMVATLLDVNQSNLPQATGAAGIALLPRAKFSYAGALFSTAGFSGPAMNMALAHGISLVEIDTPEFRPLLDAITDSADRIVAWNEGIEAAAGAVLEADEAMPADDVPKLTGGLILALRTALRESLGTQTFEAKEAATALAAQLTPLLDSATSAAKETGLLFVGMSTGPFMLILKADDPEKFVDYVRDRPSHNVRIGWGAALDDGGTWYITPFDQLGTDDGYRLTFRLPSVIRNWVFSEENTRRAAKHAKEQFFPNISIVHVDGDRELLIRLKYSPSDVQLAVTQSGEAGTESYEHGKQ